MTQIVVIGAKRTPQGRFLGGLSKWTAVDLAVAAGRAVLQGGESEGEGEARGDGGARIDPRAIDQVIVGNVLGAGQGMNIARQVGVKLGLPIEVPAFTVNMMCASGLQAVMLGAQAIRAGDANVVLCGGTESMSNAPYLLPRARTGYKLGDAKVVDSLLHDGLVDSFDHEHMGLTAERLAERYDLSRQQQDAFAARSQHRYAQAMQAGLFDDEIVPVGDVARDEHPRADTTAESLAKLKPAFRADGSVTAGNASGINDGAAMLLVCDEATAIERGWRPLARVAGWASAGCDPKVMGLGPVHATRKLLARSGGAVADFDAIEINEAFAAQALACLREFDLDADAGHVNAHGGAIALGHPIGASGARLVVHLAHQVARGRGQTALATLCVGGGMGASMSLAR